MFSKAQAQQIVDTLPTEPTLMKYSSVWAMDFVELTSPVGATVHLKTTAGHFDDLPAFVDAKMTYFVPGAVYEPISVVTIYLIWNLCKFFD
jgi:hypothetical protein